MFILTWLILLFISSSSASSEMSGNLTLMIPPLTEGQQTNLTCTANPCSTGETPVVAWKCTKSMENTSFNINNVTESQKRNSTVTFKPSVTHHGSTVTCQVTCPNSITANVTEVLNATYVNKLEISGDKTINEGDALNLTCRFDGFPQTLLIWTKLGSNTSMTNGTGAATLFMSKVTEKDSGQYMCTAQNQNRNLTVDVAVRLRPQILDQSDCKSQQDVLTCVCISQGFPSPTITWEPLQNPINYSISTVVLNHTVTSTVSINMKGVSNISAVCISSNTNGKTSRNLSITEVEGEGNITNYLWTFTQMGIIIPFLIGVLVSAFISCLLWLCCRKKHKSHGSTSETLEMVMTQETNGGHTVDYEPIPARGTAGGSNGSEAGTSDIEYSDIHLLIKQDAASPSGNKPKEEVTDYAKIKPKRERKMEEGEGREEEEEMKLASVPEDEESETVAVYSNVTNLKDQM
uniref:Ig-like domain-containing protein n=2 Tax=Poecilia mexicana TaxID=48701 RepID=A0A3B3X133_9TELE